MPAKLSWYDFINGQNDYGDAMSIARHIFLFTAICAMTFLGGCAVTPNQPTPQPAKVDQVVSADENPKGPDVVCDTELETGSHLRRQEVCVSEQDRDSTERALSAMRSHSNGVSSH
ncbi:MAG: hypothetical protein JWR16_2655 [Nevskia sp.]|nr:hypothetical protein [Nevskia sp.]